MKEKKISKKIPGGKLLRVEVEFKDSTIHSVRITGDFFLHPEGGLMIIEEALFRVEVEDMEQIIYDVVERESIEMLGVSPSDIAELIFEALE